MSVSPSLVAALLLVLAGSAIQVAVGAGLSVVCGAFMLLWLGPKTGVPVLLGLNLLVSVVATVVDARAVLWRDALFAAVATLAGCFVASRIPGLSDAALKLITAIVLLVVALPRPPSPESSPSPAAGSAGIALAGLVTGAVTVWTATPGPIIPMALARVGRSGADIRRTMQPISIVGYGAALLWVGWPTRGTLGEGSFAGLVSATLVGIAAGFGLRAWISPPRVILLVRVTAGVAAILLVASVLRGAIG
ncbi:hypothetical protein RHAL1_03537 [Beijerinckiaceae bacterium RH AL1]|nr:hypothetical protein [Beijerinckiaceae bacterium]VVB48869.1 hypothetical protein RHCH11_RHCH11_03472 [Beijerinckiaceae bacterium RH CH11]VVB48946.1 hypothetical protein RHAL8_03468 [Beijerinckiaceae bacterium RH AL8]VVC56608.1 hypothetical protein RHAL1_03537 [Beijerinckiaceae bacterium RH AL1]